MPSHLIQLCKYNYWANERICGYILQAGSPLVDEVITSSFHSIRKTLYHLWDGQEIWYKRLHGESINTWPSHYFKGNLEEAVQLILGSSGDYVRFAELLTQNEKDKMVEYKAIDGKPFYNSIEEIIMHTMNHGSYHRGQLITMLRIAGFTAVGSTDMIRFFREQKRNT